MKRLGAFLSNLFMANLQRKLGRRFQRYISARQNAEEKHEDPRDIWERMIKSNDILCAMAIDSQSNDIFPVHGLNNSGRIDLNRFAREYVEMAIEFSLNIDPSDEFEILRLRNDEKEIILTEDNGILFVFVQSLIQEGNNHVAKSNLD